jgi:hypothetical protein
MPESSGRYYCRLCKVETEIIWTERGQPICFYDRNDPGGSNTGNVCDEDDGNFIELGCVSSPALTQPE